MANKLTEKIRIKRTDKDKSSLSSVTLDYGEPLLLKDSYLVVGPKEAKTVDKCKSFKAVSDALVDKQLFHSKNEGSVTSNLIDEDNNIIKINSSSVVSTDGSSVERYIDAKTESVLKSAQAYASSEDNKVIRVASSYTEDKCSDTLTLSRTYTDSKLSALKYAKSESVGGPAITIKCNPDTTTKIARVACIGSTDVPASSTPVVYNENIYINCQTGVLMGAAWNDIAEYRCGVGYAGQCVCENESGILNISSKRLQRCPHVVSDTFGFAIGKTDKAKLPVAISGRVLAFTDDVQASFNVGDVVCSGKDGTVSKMNRLEIILFPDRILGVVSEVPDYDTWNNVVVDNRIWISLK